VQNFERALWVKPVLQTTVRLSTFDRQPSTEGNGYRRDPEKCQEGAFLGHLPYLAAQPPRVESNKAAI
jgi:hypothetical protein